MKEWILSVFFLQNKLKDLAAQIDSEIKIYSLSLTMDTNKLFDKVMQLQDKRRRVVNFKVLYDIMKDNLSASEKTILADSAKGNSFNEIGQKLNVSKSTAARYFKQAIDKCTNVAHSLNFTLERFKKEYGDILLIHKTASKFSKNN